MHKVKLYKSVRVFFMKLKKLNKLFAALLLFAVVFTAFGVTAFATPEVMSAEAVSTAYNLVTLKAPETDGLSTTNKCLPISCAAPEGAVVTVYKYSAATGTYNKLYTSEGAAEATVGATMLFATQAELSLGSNKFLIRSAVDDSTYQIVKFEVTLLNEGFMDKIKSIAGMIFN